jgi:hypothetical protein
MVLTLRLIAESSEVDRSEKGGDKTEKKEKKEKKEKLEKKSSMPKTDRPPFIYMLYQVKRSLSAAAALRRAFR